MRFIERPGRTVFDCRGIQMGRITSYNVCYTKLLRLILNVAVGGNWGGAQGIDNSIFPQSMEVDYVRVYELPINYQ